jgi:TonB-linked SusC/RagA family outer membrane protein
MRKFLSLLAVLVLATVLAYAQTKTVSGKITDPSGNPVPFASLLIKGKQVGSTADQNGAFSLKASDGDILVITSQGYKSKEVPIVANQTIFSFSLEKSSGDLAEVIISSGYNTKKTQRSTVSNAQVVASEQLNTIRQSNLNNALAGKVAGIQLRGQSVAALGRDANIRLRGDGTLGGQSLLYIVDGTPTNSIDINPDDVEDLTVLNGPTGAAIYGPQAADGAIVINTKRAKRNQKGIGVELNTGAQFDRIYMVPNYQNTYAGGGVPDLMQFTWKDGMPTEWKALDGKYYHDYSDDASWGPRMAGQEYIPWYAWYPNTQYSYKTAKLNPQPDNARDFYNTGITTNNNINFSKAGESYNTRFSYSNLYTKGLIPNTFLKRNTFAFNGSVDLSNRFTISTNINYVTQNQQAENDDAYSNQSNGSFNQWFHRDLDIKIMKELRGVKSFPGSQGAPAVLGSWNHSNPGAYSAVDPVSFLGGNYWYNPYSYFDNIENMFRRDRLYGDISLTYKVNNEIKIRGAYRKNFVTTWSENKQRYILETSATQTQQKAGYATGESYFKDDRYELVGTFDKKLKDFTLNLLAGGEVVRIQSKSISANTRDGLYIPDFFSLDNSLSTIAQNNSRSEEKRGAIFTRVGAGYKNMLFAEATLRNDWYSTLAKGDNSIFVKSFGASFVFGDLVADFVPWLSFGKLRATWGETPKALSPYSLELGYGVGADQWDGHFVMGTPNAIVDPKLTGSVQTTKEIGLDLRFLRNRIGLSATYYDALTSKSPVSVAINGASGFTSKSVNAGRIVRKGVELQLFLRPIQTKDINWEINASYANIIKNEVEELAPGVDQITLSSGAGFSGITPPVAAHQVGQPWGMIIGGGKTIDAASGLPVLTSDGHYVKMENKRFGSSLPQYTGGFQSSFSYKNFVFNVNLDYQWGGKFFSLSDMWGSYSGLLARTAVLNDKGNPIRDAVADGGGIHMVGVDGNKNAVDMYVEAQDYFHNMVSDNVFDEFIYDLTFVKLREVSIGYRIPVQKLGIAKYIQNATFSIVSRNPWLMYSKTKDFDPSEISNVFGENGQLPGSRSLGFNLKIGF